MSEAPENINGDDQEYASRGATSPVNKNAVKNDIDDPNYVKEKDDVRSLAELTTYVQSLLQQMQDRFQSMSDQIITRIDEIQTRLDDLEKNIVDLMTQAGVEEK